MFSPLRNEDFLGAHGFEHFFAMIADTSKDLAAAIWLWQARFQASGFKQRIQVRSFLFSHPPHLLRLWDTTYLRNVKPAFNHSRRMAGSPCCVWFMTHLTSAQVELHFFWPISYFLTAQSIFWLSQRHGAKPGSPTSQPMHWDVGTRRRRHAADKVGQPREHTKRPTAQTQAPETPRSLSLWVRIVRCLQEHCRVGASEATSSRDREWNLPHEEGQSRITQNHRMVGVGRDLCGSPNPTLLPKQGHPEQAAQPCPGGSWISPEKETPPPPWAAWARAPSPSEGRSSSSCSAGASSASVCTHSPLSLCYLHRLSVVRAWWTCPSIPDTALTKNHLGCLADPSGIQSALQVPRNLLQCSQHRQAGFYGKIF